MIAIFTKFLGPTTHRPSRIVAYTTNGHRLCLSKSRLEDELEAKGLPSGDTETIHRAAAQALADKRSWPGELIAGGFDKGYVFTFKSPYKNHKWNDANSCWCNQIENILSVRDTLLAWKDNASLMLRTCKSEDEGPYKNQVANYNQLAVKLDEVAEVLRKM